MFRNGFGLVLVNRLYSFICKINKYLVIEISENTRIQKQSKSGSKPFKIIIGLGLHIYKSMPLRLLLESTFFRFIEKVKH